MPAPCKALPSRLLMGIMMLFAFVTPHFANCQDTKWVGKGPKNGALSGFVYVIPEWDVKLSKCVQRCIRDNQMAAVGMEVIRANCRQQCGLEQALAMARSRDRKTRMEGVKRLCAIDDRRVVPVLCEALERELRERTGLFAWIIPALARQRDPSAVPVLVKSLQTLDETWLGREMSAAALGEIGDLSAIPALNAAAQRGDTRDAAIVALAKFNDKRVVPALLSALQPEEYPETRAAAMAGLHRLGRQAVPAMISAFARYSAEHPETQRRVWLCRLLAESGDERAAAVLRKSENDPDKAVRTCVQAHVRKR